MFRNRWVLYMNSANLKRHLKRHHQQAFDKVEEKDSEVTKKTVAERKRAKYHEKKFF